jgi:hypothetical protein
MVRSGNGKVRRGGMWFNRRWMSRSLSQIAADFDALTSADFDYSSLDANAWEKVARLCDEMREINDASVCAPVMFRTMERLDDVDLGTPGPLVHKLETWRGVYEAFLKQSVLRKPSPLTVWTVNRILNTQPSDGEIWLALLTSAIEHPSPSEPTKSDAGTFLEHQIGKRTA